MFKYIFKNKWKSIVVLIIDILGTIIFFPFIILRRTKKYDIKKILVIRLDQIGDVIQTIPFFEKLRNKYPLSEIYALVSKETAFLLEPNKNINKIFKMENSWFYKEKRINIKEIINMVKILKKEKIDVVFDLRGDFRNILLAFISGAKAIYGYGCTGGAFLLTHEKVYIRDMHEIDKNLNLISEKSENNLKIDFITGHENYIEIKNFLSSQKMLNPIKKIVIHPFARNQAKLWGFNNFSILIKKMTDNHKNIKIFIIGSKEDKKYQNYFFWNEEIVNCIGTFSISSTIELIKHCDIFIGCDSGPQYFAAYSNKKTCIIYGYVSNHLRWKPKVPEENFLGFSKTVDCGYCELEVCPIEKKHKCMEIITPDEVYEKIKNWLS